MVEARSRDKQDPGLSASAYGGNGGGHGAEVGGGDARLEMRKVRRGYISRMVGVSILRLCFVIH